MIYYAIVEYITNDIDRHTEFFEFTSEKNRKSYLDSLDRTLKTTFSGRNYVEISLFESENLKTIKYKKNPQDKNSHNSRFVLA